MRLTKAQRLKTPKHFQAVYASKQWGNTPLFSFNVLAQSSNDSACVLGVTVSKKVSKNAVDRNRIKRQIKEYYRLKQDEIKDAHVVITAKPACMRASDDERMQGLAELWSKLKGWQRWHKKQSITQENEKSDS